jgi:hypothetical protein
VQHTRQRFVEGNLDRGLNEDPRPGARKKLDERGEAVLETLGRSKSPEGRKNWTLQLLADRLVELRFVDSISSINLGIDSTWDVLSAALSARAVRNSKENPREMTRRTKMKPR